MKNQLITKILSAIMSVMLAVAVLPVKHVYALDTGWRSPSTVPTTQWANPTNAYTSNNVWANEVDDNGEVIYAGFGISIPAGNVIKGIEVRAEGYTNNSRDIDVDLSWAATGNNWTAKNNINFANNNSVDEILTVGGPTDTWGHNWTIAETALLRLRLTADNDNGTFFLDHVQVIVYYDLPPEMNVQGNAVSIGDGDTGTTLANHTDFGNIPGGFFVDRTFTIQNTGTGPLTIGAITFTGGDAGDFSVVSAPTSTVAANSSTTFTVRLTAGNFGNPTRDTSINIANDDANENPYSFAVQGTRFNTEINVQGNGITINDGDGTPGPAADCTVFGSALIGGFIDCVYTIQNSGPNSLSVGTVILGGVNAGDFSVETAPVSPVANGGSTLFTVRFTPSATGLRSATVSFINNDNNESPYNWSIAGTGLTNTAPTITTPNGGAPTTFSIVENNSAVTDVDATDPNVPPQSLTYSISGTDADDFSIAPATGVLTFSSAPNFETPTDADVNNSYIVIIQVSDGTVTDTQTITVNVTNANETPTDIVLTASSIAENNVVNTIIGALSTTDPDLGNTFTYSLTCTAPGADDASFNINIADLRASSAFNFETKSSYAICVRSTDQGGLFFDKNFTISVTNVNETPTNIALTASSIAENNVVNAIIGALSTTDPDLGNTFTYSLACAAPGADDASFNINAANLRASSAFNFETKSSYAICVRSTDQGGLLFDKNFTITVNDVNETPTDIALTASSLAENNAVNAIIGALSTTDLDAGNTFTYSLVNGGLACPGTNNASFNVSGSNLQAASAFDYEIKNSYVVCIRTTDQGLLTFDKPFTISVTDVNEAPIVTDIPDQSIAEGATFATINLDDYVSDVDNTDAQMTWSYTGNAALAVSIDANRIATISIPNVDWNGSETITFTATDLGLFFNSNAASFTVTAVNDAPIVTDIPGQSIAEGATFATINLDDYVSDIDNTDAQMTWSYTGNAALAVSIDASRIATISIPNADWNGSETITFTATDLGPLSDNDVATFTVTAVNDAPVTSNVTDTTNEDSPKSITLSYIDVESDLATSCSVSGLSSGSISTACACVAGTCTVGITPALNATAQITASYTVDDVATSNNSTITLDITPLNDAPTCNDVTITTDEGTTGTTAPDCADVDGDTLSYSVVGSASNGTRSFVTPNLSYAPNSNFNGSDAFTYKANDSTVDSNTANVGVTINAVNVTPSFTKGADQTVNEDAGAKTIAGWATAIEDGDPELTQNLIFNIIGNTNAALFSAVPAVDTATGDLTYTPAANANGSATITITLSDDGGGADTSPAQTFVINVTPVNDAPSFTSAAVTIATQDVAYTYNIVTTDPDTGDTLVIDASTLPTWLTFVDNLDRTATLSGTPTNSEVGSHHVVLRVSDGTAVAVDQDFIIVVDNVNDAPSFTSAPVTSAGESTLYTYNVTTADLDPTDTLAISAATLPAWLTLVDNGDRTATLSGTPNSGQVGIHSVVLEVTDGISIASQKFNIDVSNSAPLVSLIATGKGGLTEAGKVSVGINQLLVTFNQDVYDPAGDTDLKDVTNPANYLLVRDNGDGFQTISCTLGADVLDTAIATDSVIYSNGGGAGPFVSTLSINGGLPLSNGVYRLYVCGTTSIVDIVDNTLELAGDGFNAGTDFPRNFTVSISNNGNGDNGNGNGKNNQINNPIFGTSNLLIPVTGFAPNQTTLLPAQSADKSYKPLGEMRIEIPTLGINFPIVGAAVSKNTWDLTWLKNSVAYLEGSAYPTLSGNTVLTAHVTDANNNLGPFSDIKGMHLGDKIYLHAYGQTFVYQVQESQKILPANISTVFKHEEYDWITLVTCEDYDAKTASYQHRRMVRAVLISVVPEK